MASTSVASEAFQAFREGEHVRCGQLLDQIGTSKGAFDVKASHNALLNSYYRDGCENPKALLAKLTEAYEKARERDKKEKGRRKRDEEEDEVKDEDFSVLRYNQALLCLQLRQYAQATLILEELFENIEPIDDFLAIKICFLLLELSLLQRDAETALPVLNYLEKPNAFLNLLRSERTPKAVMETRAADDAGAEGDDQQLEKSEKGGGKDELSLAAGGDSAAPTIVRAEAPVAPEAPEGPLPSLVVGSYLSRHGRAPDAISRHEYKFYCHMYRARLQALLKNTKAAKKDVKTAMEILEQELRRVPLLTCSEEQEGGTKESEPAQTALRDALNNQQSAIVMMCKANLEYSRQNVRKAMKLLSLCQFNFAQSRPTGEDGGAERPAGADDDAEAAPSSLADFHPAQEEDCASLFFNNLGCLNFMIHKPNLATLYFQKALRFSKVPDGQDHPNLLSAKASATKPGLIATRHWLDRRAETAYNTGLQMLMCERPVSAFRLFSQCIPVFRQWPRLWMRLAECCIELHRQRGAEATPDPSAGSWSQEASRLHGPGQRSSMDLGGAERKLAWSVEGTGPLRRWLLTTSKRPAVGGNAGGGEGEGNGQDDGAAEKGAGGAKAASEQGADDLPACLAGEGVLTYAAMCLRNVVVLTASAIPAAGGSKATANGDGIADAAGQAAGGLTANGAGAGDKAAAVARAAKPPAAADGKDAKAGDKSALAPSPKASVSSPGGTGAGAGGARHQARDTLEAEASLLEDSALVKLAYVALCQNDHAAALRYSRRLLEKNYVVSQDNDGGKKHWAFQAGPFMQAFAAQAGKTPAKTEAPAPKFPASVGCVMLAVFYAAEALLMSGKAAEAKSLLGGYVQGGALQKGADLHNAALQEADRLLSVHVAGVPRRSGGEETDPAVEAQAAAVCGGVNPNSSMGGLTSCSYVLYCAGGPVALQAVRSKETSGGGKVERETSEKERGVKENGQAALVVYPPSELPRLADNQSMLLTNLAAVHVQDGNLREAERCCEKALQAQPRALAPLRTLVYVLLRRGKHAQALARLKQSRLSPLRPGDTAA